ncbi:FecCD family ABC transporter permease [Cumulibacter soli]|uniref:FecCD family ABC transporter permease n=1 Tax=Cumulibacter soli TaxID=2546344 RepID=UPI001068AC6C|nr:iron chelate uptake ABC transporter family permease subunit [Cumulibacter soli]
MSDLVLRAGPVSLRVRRRLIIVTGMLLLLIATVSLLGLCFGADWSTPGDALAALFGHGDEVVVIRDWRLPRVLAAIVFGAGLGISGAIFQNVTRNALGSPDVIGLDAGSYTGALLALTLLGGTTFGLSSGAVLGGLLAAGLIYFLSRGGSQVGLRLIIIGIAINAMLTAVNQWIILRSDLEIAIAGTVWSSGSLSGIGWDDVALPFTVVGVLTLCALLLARAMHQSTLGDAAAHATGVNLGLLRPALIVVGVGLTAAVTATCGPIVFIALAAPQIGRRLAGTEGVGLLPAMVTGAALLLIADVTAQMALAPLNLPVGVVTTAIGGAYLIWLLIREARR